MSVFSSFQLVVTWPLAQYIIIVVQLQTTKKKSAVSVYIALAHITHIHKNTVLKKYSLLKINHRIIHLSTLTS